MSLADAIKTIEAAGLVFSDQARHLGVNAVAQRLDCSPKWVRENVRLFPNAWRMESGELRIPVADIEAMARNGRHRV
jgi:hypothetical protein